MYRLFIAADLRRDTDARLDELTAAASRGWGRTFRPVAHGRRHLTLVFLGDTDPDLVKPMARDLREVTAAESPFQMRVEGAGAFPTPQRARVLWGGVSDGADRLTNLAEGLVEVLTQKYGLRKDDRSFHPHVTVGRFRGEPADVSEIVSSHADRLWGIDPVEEVLLIRSQLSRGAPTYTVMEKLSLGFG